MTSRTLTFAAALVVVVLAGAHPAGAQEPQMPIPPGEGAPPAPVGQPVGQPYYGPCDAGGYDIHYGCAGGCYTDGCYGGGCDGGYGGGCGGGCQPFCIFGDCGCDGCGPGGGCCDDDCLIAYTRFDVMYWRRDRPNNVPLTSDGTDGPIVLDTDDLPMNDWEAMPRFSFGVPISHCLLVEGVYFGTPTWEDEASVVSPTNNLYSTYSDFGTNPPGGYAEFDQSRVQFIQYKSMLHNAEGNFWCLLPDHWCGTQILLLSGFRYVNIREIFRYETLASGRGQLNTIETYNDLLAWQLGCRIDAQVHRCLHVLLEGKAGLAVNLAKQRTEFLGLLGTPALINEGANNDHIALVTDVGLTLVYDVCPWMSLRGGYHIMYVDGVALAPENLVPIAPVTGLRVPAIDDHGAIFYQGATAGVEVRW